MSLVNFIILLMSFSTLYSQSEISDVATQLAEHQLTAYNNRDIEAFLEPYAEDVIVYGFPCQMIYQGKANMRARYASFFDRTPDLHCHLVNRIVHGDTVIDQEEVTVNKGEPPMKAVAIYKIKDEKISEIYFIMDR